MLSIYLVLILRFKSCEMLTRPPMVSFPLGLSPSFEVHYRADELICGICDELIGRICDELIGRIIR